MGLEREMRGYPAGIRTIALVTMGACLFTDVSQLLGDIDTTQPNMSQHLSTLYRAGVLGKRRDAKGNPTADDFWIDFRLRFSDDKTLEGATFDGDKPLGKTRLVRLSDPELLGDRIDWIAKRQLLSLFAESEGVALDDPAMIALDLAYHDIDPLEGLYYALVEQGRMQTLVSPEAVQHAVEHPPADTRAAIRGLCVQRYPKQVESINWERILLRNDEQSVRLDLSQLTGDLRDLNRRLTAATDITEFVNLLQSPRRASEPHKEELQ